MFYFLKGEKMSVVRKTIKEVFNTDIQYVRAAFQRAYIWKPQKVEKFWKEIINCIEDDNSIFLGFTIVE